MDKYIGKVLDNRYEIESLLGTGGMANVYKAKCRRLSRYVAVKILKDEFANDKEFKSRFENESNAVARLSHKNIVNVYDVSNGEEIDYIVMELIEGITLKEYLSKKGKLDWKQTLFFSYQIAEALEHAHSRGIIHQDIKPHNIMLLRDGTLKVADFGIAKLENEGETKIIKEAIGSVHYISPEQAKGSTIDSRTDIYSLGVVMYEMLSGSTPFKGDTAISIVMQHINALPAPLSTIEAEIPKSLEYVILKAMNPTLKKRYKSATEIISDLEKIKANPNMILDTEVAQDFDKTQAINFESMPAMLDDDSADDFEDDFEEEITKPKKSILIAIFAVLAIVLASGIFVFSSVFLREPSTITAPSLVDLFYDEVLESKLYQDYTIEISEEVFDIEVEAGKIISQQPEANKKITKNETIYVVVSKGAKSLVVPDITGYEQAQAGIELRRQKIEYVEQYEYSDDITEGKVIGTDPKALEEISEKTVVTVFISSGKEVELATVPNLKGLTVDAASEMLRKNNLILGDVTEEVSLNQIGTIISQGVESGVTILSGTRVNVVIAKKAPEPETKTATITVEIPQGTEHTEFLMEVFADNELVHAKTYSTSQKSFNLVLEGEGSATVYIYADGELIREQVVRYS